MARTEPRSEAGEVAAATAAAGRGRATDDGTPAGDEVRRLEAEVAALRGEVERRDAALVALAERLVPVEQAREAGRAEERRRRSEAEGELRKLQATRLYRLLLRPRAVLYRFRQRRGTVD